MKKLNPVIKVKGFAAEQSMRLSEKAMAKTAEANPSAVKGAPLNTSVGRIDDVKASRPKTLRLKWS